MEIQRLFSVQKSFSLFAILYTTIRKEISIQEVKSGEGRVLNLCALRLLYKEERDTGKMQS